MSRRHAAQKRAIVPDAKYGNVVLAKFINNLMYKGKKTTAEGIVYGAIELLEQRYHVDGLEVFLKALDNVRPAVEVRSRRVGGATYQVPVEVRESRGMALAMRWLIKAARARNERTMKRRLMAEILDASKDIGQSVKTRANAHNMAEANKAFSHYRW